MKRLRTIAILWIFAFLIVLLIFLPREMKYIIPAIAVLIIGFCAGVWLVAHYHIKIIVKVCDHFGISEEEYRKIEKEFKI